MSPETKIVVGTLLVALVIGAAMVTNLILL